MRSVLAVAFGRMAGTPTAEQIASYDAAALIGVVAIALSKIDLCDWMDGWITTDDVARSVVDAVSKANPGMLSAPPFEPRSRLVFPASALREMFRR